MPECKECGNEAEKLVSVKAGGKTRKLCEDCRDRAKESDAIAEESEGVVQGRR